MNESEEKPSGHCQGTVEIILPPTYDYNLGAFDNEDSFPNLSFVIEGVEKPLRLHKITLIKVSKYIERLLKEKREKGEDGNKIEWMIESKKEVDKQVIVKALRFCYGESVSVGVKDGECCAMISVLKKLEVVCGDIVSDDLIEFAIKESKKEVETGVELLKCVDDYQECLDKKMDEMLASVVFTKKNMMEHYDLVVGDCLMRLPSKYLDMVEYKEGHCDVSEFKVRARYVREHEQLSKEEKEKIMMKCKWDDMKIEDLEELKQLDTIGVDILWNICVALFRHEESEREKWKKEMRKVESEKEKQRKQSLYPFTRVYSKHEFISIVFCLTDKLILQFVSMENWMKKNYSLS